jgi:hypothetical protein
VWQVLLPQAPCLLHCLLQEQQQQVLLLQVPCCRPLVLQRCPW